MRTVADRIRHMLLFEGIAIVIVTPVAMWITGDSLGRIGSLAIIMSLLAMAWNYLFNLGFDYWLLRTRATTERSWLLRMAHALLFELGLVLAGVPLVAWWLSMTLWQALLMDLGFILFFLVYAFVYNWLYDHLFPVPVRASAS